MKRNIKIMLACCIILPWLIVGQFVGFFWAALRDGFQQGEGRYERLNNVLDKEANKLDTK